MAKMNVSLDEDIQRDLQRLIPARKRSQVINEALRKELLRHKRASATERLLDLRKRTAKFSEKTILSFLRHDRSRSSR
jgi:metal-responsive CopG/Arc/MetJ family transcriptional regulator